MHSKLEKEGEFEMGKYFQKDLCYSLLGKEETLLILVSYEAVPSWFVWRIWCCRKKNFLIVSSSSWWWSRWSSWGIIFPTRVYMYTRRHAHTHTDKAIPILPWVDIIIVFGIFLGRIRINVFRKIFLAWSKNDMELPLLKKSKIQYHIFFMLTYKNNFVMWMDRK